jgi:DNA-binding CsgD family transcriptional regulator
VLRAIVDYDECARAAPRRAAYCCQPARGRQSPVRAIREAEILRLVAVRRTNKEIAAELSLSVHTVERHVQNAYRKIDARNRADAGDYVARVGL